MPYQSLILDIVEISRRLNASGILSPPGYGNISARVPSEEAFLIDSDSILYERLSPTKIAKVSFDGRILKGNVRETTKGVFDLHGSVYKARDDVNAIIHTHSPYATAFAIAGKSIPCTTYELEWVNGGEVAVAKFARRGDKEMAISVLQAIGSKNTVLMANHGLIAVGKDLNTAFLNALAVEDAAKKNYMALSVGVPLPLPPRS
jgi:L-fuculose-phosphate aldolase